MPKQGRRQVERLPSLRSRLSKSEGFAAVLAALQSGHSAAIDGAWGSSCALAAATLASEAGAPFLIVLPRLADVDEFADDVAEFIGMEPTIFPAWESLPEEHRVADEVFGGRLRVLTAMESKTPPTVVVTSFPALLQPVPSAEDRRDATRTIRVGDDLDHEEFLEWLVERGFSRVSGVTFAGEFSVRGGIVDIFPPDAVDPLRFEFFGDEVESIRRFDVETQRKTEELSSIALTLVGPVDSLTDRDGNESSGASRGENFAESLPENSWIALVELQNIVEEGRRHLERLDDPRGLYSVEAALAYCTKRPTVTIAPIAADSMETTCHLQIESIERFSGPKNEALEELASVVGRSEKVMIACHNEGERERLGELLAACDSLDSDRVELCLGRLARGFRMVAERLIILSDHELFGRVEIRRGSSRRRVESRAIDSFLELRENDLVVHLTHGIARYRGMKLLEKDDQVEEHLDLEFRDKVHVYVPVSLIHLVQKYVGAAKVIPDLSKLGTTSWSKKKKKVAEAVSDLAADMIRLQAARESRPGIAYPEDSHWQQEFDAAFPYTETADQMQAIIDCKQDMQRTQPMDRLICGDVGYGKTEVAMRAAFKAIDAGRQAAILVPTTVLAEQHYRTICERMAEYPVTIESLSRFKTKGEQKQILEGMKSGAVDLVVGTHRLIQKDVSFKNLGILIIDEEQRFGVAAKEMLKQIRLEIDVLTLSATPIPRTLHMSLLGVRDISNLETAPQDRMAIVTRVCRFDGELIRQAIVRELNRNGQIYFVHNRVYDIQSVADRLQQIVPEAEIGIAHGQMREHQLEAAMMDFVGRKIDILVCTTIIESGLDIPNANTIFIHRADNYGLADLHQLRGRVGRYKVRAYCYLLLEEGRTLSSTGAKRLKAIEEYSELGAGFKIAMRDLEIRGAGNILGTQQSGHIASVGYELYCRLLDNAVRRLKNEPMREQHHVSVDLPVSAYLPRSYVPLGRSKIEVYRRLSNIADLQALAELQNELRDRFGPIPEEAVGLLDLTELQVLARNWMIDDIHLEDRFAVFGYRHPQKIRQLADLCGPRLRIVDKRNAYLLLGEGNTEDGDLIGELKSVLQLEAEPAYNPPPI